MIKIKITNLRRFQSRLRKLQHRLFFTVPQQLERAGMLTSSIIQKRMYGSRTRAKRKGRPTGIYQKRGKGKRKKFKRVGNIPDHVLGIDTGMLRKSLGGPSSRSGIWKKKSRRGVFQDVHTLIVGTRVVYAAIHEHGGMGIAFGKYRFRMPKRPFMAPGVAIARPKIKARFGKNIRLTL